MQDMLLVHWILLLSLITFTPNDSCSRLKC